MLTDIEALRGETVNDATIAKIERVIEESVANTVTGLNEQIERLKNESRHGSLRLDTVPNRLFDMWIYARDVRDRMRAYAELSGFHGEHQHSEMFAAAGATAMDLMDQLQELREYFPEEYQ